MSLDWYNDVLKFVKADGREVPEELGFPAESEIDARMVAMSGVLANLHSAVEGDDVVEVADALTLVVFEAIKTAVAFGVNLPSVWEAIPVARDHPCEPHHHYDAIRKALGIPKIRQRGEADAAASVRVTETPADGSPDGDSDG